MSNHSKISLLARLRIAFVCLNARNHNAGSKPPDMTLPQILTGLLAVYGALLSTATFLILLRSKRWHASVSFSIPGGINKVFDNAIVLNIANACERSIVITGIMLYTIRIRRLWLLPPPDLNNIDYADLKSILKDIHYKLRHRLWSASTSSESSWVLKNSSEGRG
jgi:hypothetical protein